MDCEQAETRWAHAQLRSGRHDNAKVTVTTPSECSWQAGGTALQQATALHTRVHWTAAATVYKRVQRLNKSLQTKHRTYQRLKTADHDESSAVTTPLFLVSEAQHAPQRAELRS